MMIFFCRRSLPPRSSPFLNPQSDEKASLCPFMSSLRKVRSFFTVFVVFEIIYLKKTFVAQETEELGEKNERISFTILPKD